MISDQICTVSSAHVGSSQDVNRQSACQKIPTYLHACHAIDYRLRSACILISLRSTAQICSGRIIIKRSAMHRAAHHQGFQA